MTCPYYLTEMEYKKPEPKHKLVFQSDLVTLQQGKPRQFLVRYGMEVYANLDYVDAAAKLGQALMHQAACDGSLLP